MLVLLVVVIVAIGAFMLGMIGSPNGSRVLSAHFSKLCEGQAVCGNAVGVAVTVSGGDAGNVRLATATSDSAGNIKIFGLPAESLGWTYGGQTWSFYSQVIDLRSGDLSLERGVAGCPSPPCSDPRLPP